MANELLVCKCKEVVGCSVPLANENGIVQKLCYKTCLEIPNDCSRIKTWTEKREYIKCIPCERIELFYSDD